MHERFELGDQIVGSDYSSFEKHFNKNTFQIEMILYEYMLQNVPQGSLLVKILELVLMGVNELIFRRVKIDVPAGRMSGEMNTSLGNGFANLMLFLFICEDSGCSDADCLVEGDDLVGKFKGKLVESKYTECGFTIKLVYFDKYYYASFCGLVYHPIDMVSMPDPIKVILNVGWVSARYVHCSEKKRKQLLRCKGYSLLYQYAGCPIVQELAMCILRLTSGCRYLIPAEWSHWQRKNFKTTGVAKAIGYDSRLVMERCFGVTVSEQYELEKYFLNKPDISPIEHWALDRHFSIDVKDYYRRFVRNTTSRIPPDLHTVLKSVDEQVKMVSDVSQNVGNVKLSNESFFPNNYHL